MSVYGTVTILYDSTNEPPSNSAYLALAAYAIQKYPLVTENSLDIHDLTRLVSTDIEGSFMLIPNTMYYNNCDVIAKAVKQAVNGEAKQQWICDAVVPDPKPLNVS